MIPAHRWRSAAAERLRGLADTIDSAAARDAGATAGDPRPAEHDAGAALGGGPSGPTATGLTEGTTSGRGLDITGAPEHWVRLLRDAGLVPGSARAEPEPGGGPQQGNDRQRGNGPSVGSKASMLRRAVAFLMRRTSPREDGLLRHEPTGHGLMRHELTRARTGVERPGQAPVDPELEDPVLSGAVPPQGVAPTEESRIAGAASGNEHRSLLRLRVPGRSTTAAATKGRPGIRTTTPEPEPSSAGISGQAAPRLSLPTRLSPPTGEPRTTKRSSPDHVDAQQVPRKQVQDEQSAAGARSRWPAPTLDGRTLASRATDDQARRGPSTPPPLPHNAALPAQTGRAVVGHSAWQEARPDREPANASIAAEPGPTPAAGGVWPELASKPGPAPESPVPARIESVMARSARLSEEQQAV